jgi:hypothetical protein
VTSAAQQIGDRLPSGATLYSEQRCTGVRYSSNVETIRASLGNGPTAGRLRRRLVQGVTALVMLAVIAAASVWTWFRAQDKTWAWWSPPPVLTSHGRDYSNPGRPVSLLVAKAEGNGNWTHVQDEWPMGWPMWASRSDGYAPTVIFVCTTKDHCLPYSLEGGP